MLRLLCSHGDSYTGGSGKRAVSGCRGAKGEAGTGRPHARVLIPSLMTPAWAIQMRRILVLLTVTVLLVATAALGESRIYADSPSHDLTPCFRHPRAGLSSAGLKEAAAYLTAQRRVAPLLVGALCSESQLAAVDAWGRAEIRVDGRASDWPDSAPTITDPAGNVVLQTNASQSAGPTPSIDLREVRAVIHRGQLLAQWRVESTPDPRASWWLHFYDEDGTRLFDLYLWADGRIFVNAFAKGRLTGTRQLTSAAGARGEVVELSVPLADFPAHSKEFRISAASFLDERKVGNWTTTAALRDVRALAATEGAFLLLRYLDGDDRNDSLPLAVAVAEAHILTLARRELHERIVEDGRKMIRLGRELAVGTLPAEAQLAWASRGAFWGGLAGLHLDRSGRITREAYYFMFVDPDVLLDARRVLLATLPQLASADTPARAAAINSWALAANRYRWKLEVLREWAGRSDHWRRIYEEAHADVKAGRDRITTVNGVQVYSWAILSPNYQWKQYRKTGWYFGPCGDVAVMSMLALKSLGVADIGWFRRFGPKDDRAHTFAGFFDPAAKRWRTTPDQLPLAEEGSGLLQWSLPALGEASLTWRKVSAAAGMELWVNERSPFEAHTATAMRRLLAEGIGLGRVVELLSARGRARSSDRRAPTVRQGILFDL